MMGDKAPHRRKSETTLLRGSEFHLHYYQWSSGNETTGEGVYTCHEDADLKEGSDMMNGQRIEYRLDLTNKNIYNSPAFYICQNDVIYVEPNFTANFQGTNFQTYTQLGTTLVSIFLSVFTLITLTK